MADANSSKSRDTRDTVSSFHEYNFNERIRRFDTGRIRLMPIMLNENTYFTARLKDYSNLKRKKKICENESIARISKKNPLVYVACFSIKLQTLQTTRVHLIN